MPQEKTIKINCEKAYQKIQELKQLQEDLTKEIKEIKKQGKSTNIFEIEKQIKQTENWLDNEFKEIKKEKQEKEEISIEKARNIFEQEGKLENFYGIENLTQNWGYDENQLEKIGIPNIEAPKWLLEKAVKMGATLTLKPALSPDNKPLTLLK